MTAFGDVFDGGTFFVGVAFFASDHLDCLIVIIGIGGALDEHIFVQAISVVIGEQVTAFTDVGDIGGVIGAGAFRAGDIACFERVIGPDVTELTVAQIGTDVIGAEDRIAAVDAAGFEDGIFDGTGIIAISFFNAFGTFDIGDGADHVLSGAAFSVGIGGEDEFSSVTVAVSGNVPIEADSGFSEFVVIRAAVAEGEFFDGLLRAALHGDGIAIDDFADAVIGTSFCRYGAIDAFDCIDFIGAVTDAAAVRDEVFSIAGGTRF